MPTVSVIISTYNRASLLTRALQSVLNQTYRDFEVIIVDDCSTDNTETVIKEYKDSRILYIHLNQNSGSSAKPRNVGLSKATGKYVALLDSDDEWLPEKLEKQVAKFNDVSEAVGIIYCGATVIHQGYITIQHPILKGSLWPLMLGECYVGISSTLIRKDCFNKIGEFDENSMCPHYDMWIRLAKHYQFDYIPDTLAIYHYTHERFSDDKLKAIQAKELRLKKYQKDYEKHPAELHRAQLSLALAYGQPGAINRHESLKYILLALQQKLKLKDYIRVAVVLTGIISPKLLYIGKCIMKLLRDKYDTSCIRKI